MTDFRGWQMTFTEFNKHFESNMTEYPTYKSAYEAVEEYHQEKTGERRYSEYRSFDNQRRKQIKKI